MPFLNSVAKTATKPFPRFLGPTTHAIADYLTIASFFVRGVRTWPRSKRAALGAFICGGSDLALSLITDYPGGVKDVISFPMHGELDWGLATITAFMPKFMGVKDVGDRAFFLMQGAGITAVTNLTDFTEKESRSRKQRTSRRYKNLLEAFFAGPREGSLGRQS
jgi:hypothetical protein